MLKRGILIKKEGGKKTLILSTSSTSSIGLVQCNHYYFLFICIVVFIIHIVLNQCYKEQCLTKEELNMYILYIFKF